MLVLAEQNRTFGYAIAASVALHALALAAHLSVRREIVVPPPEPPLVAHLVEEPPALPAPVPAAKEEPPPKPKPERPKPVGKAKPKPAPRPSIPIAAPPPAPAPVAQEPARAEAMPEEPAPAPPTAPLPSVAAITPATPAPVPDPAADLARFRQQLVDLAVRYKRYPRMALDNGWTGDVVVRIDVAASGAVTAIEVKTSSGYSVLDEQALEMFRRAAPAVQVPPALRGVDFSVDVRAIYNLQDRPG